MAQAHMKQPGKEDEMSPAPEFMPVYEGSERMKEKVAIITGGDSGIGRATAVLFAREGAKLAIVYKDENRDAARTRELVEDEGGEVLLFSGDVKEKDFCEKVVDETVEKFGQLDVLVNNAAEQHTRENLEDIPEQQLRQTFETNFFGYFFMTQAALKHLPRGAAIVCTTSITAYRGQDLLLDYASSKGAILSFVRAMASKLASKGIRVNGVAPGPIWTPLIPASFNSEEIEEFGKGSPMGRPGQPFEVAPSFLFLACEDSSYMSGQVLHPNGGEIVAS